MYRPTIEKANAMNSYTTLWEKPEIPTGIGQPEMASAQGGMSLRYNKEMLYMKSEEETEAALSIYTIGGQLAMQQRMQMVGGRALASIALLARGTYIARLTDSQGNQCAIKFSK